MLWSIAIAVLMVDVFYRVSVPYDQLYPVIEKDKPIANNSLLEDSNDNTAIDAIFHDIRMMDEFLKTINSDNYDALSSRKLLLNYEHYKTKINSQTKQTSKQVLTKDKNINTAGNPSKWQPPKHNGNKKVYEEPGRDASFSPSEGLYSGKNSGPEALEDENE